MKEEIISLYEAYNKYVGHYCFFKTYGQEHFRESVMEADDSKLKAILESILKETQEEFDRYGDILGYFVPEGYIADSRTVIAQCREYNDTSKRLRMTKKMENAAIHNIRANVRYYNKKKDVELSDTIEGFKAIVNGEVDHIPEIMFSFKGKIDDVFEAYEKSKNQ